MFIQSWSKCYGSKEDIVSEKVDEVKDALYNLTNNFGDEKKKEKQKVEALKDIFDLLFPS